MYESVKGPAEVVYENKIFRYQLTNYYPLKSTLDFAERQLKENGAIEGKDYIWHSLGSLEAIWTVGNGLPVED